MVATRTSGNAPDRDKEVLDAARAVTPLKLPRPKTKTQTGQTRPDQAKKMVATRMSRNAPDRDDEVPDAARAVTPLEHVLTTIFKATTDEHYMRRAVAIADIEDVETLILMSADNLSEIQWTDQGETKRIPIGAIQKVLQLFNWTADQHLKTPDMFFKLTAECFLDYMRNVGARAKVEPAALASVLPNCPADISLPVFDKSVRGGNCARKSCVDLTHASQHMLSDVTASDELQWITVCRRQKRKDPLPMNKLPVKSVRRRRQQRRRQQCACPVVTEIPGIHDADGAFMPTVSTSSFVKTACSHQMLLPIEESKDEYECYHTALSTSSPSVDEVLPIVYGSDCTFDGEIEIVFDQSGNEFVSVPAWTDDETAFAIDSSLIQGNDFIDKDTSFEIYEEIERDLILSMLNSVANHGSCGVKGNEPCCDLVVGDVGDNPSSANHDGVLRATATQVGKASCVFNCTATPVPARGEEIISVVSDKEVMKCRTVTVWPICSDSVGTRPGNPVRAQFAATPWYWCIPVVSNWVNSMKDAKLLRSCLKVLFDPFVVKESGVPIALWKLLNDEVIHPNGEPHNKESLHGHEAIMGQPVKKSKLLLVMFQTSSSCLASGPKQVFLCRAIGATATLESCIVNVIADRVQHSKVMVNCFDDTLFELFACDGLIDTTKFWTNKVVVPDTVKSDSHQADVESKPSVKLKLCADVEVNGTQSVTPCGSDSASMCSEKSPPTMKELKLEAFKDVEACQEPKIKPSSHCNGCTISLLTYWGAEGKMMFLECDVKENPPEGLSLRFTEQLSVLISSSVTCSPLSECWNALSYHCLCSNDANDCVGVHSVQNKDYLADVVTKRQGQVKTATFGSELVAAHAATEHVQDIQSALRLFGVHLDGPAWMCGGSQSAIKSSKIPYSALSKRWNALLHHRVCEAVEAGYVLSHCIVSAENPVDLLTRPFDCVSAWPPVDTLLLRKGDTRPVCQSMHATQGSVKCPNPVGGLGSCGVTRGAPMEYGYG